MVADGQVASGTQTAYVLALHMNLVPDDLRAPAADRLVAAIRTAGWHLTTGLAGVGYLLPVLSSTGHTAAAYRLLEQDTMPSWRYMTGHGATTIWERWDGWTAGRGFASPEMNSFNHYSLGSVGEWLYRFLLGIDQEPGTAGFGQLLLRPHPGGSLDWARGSYQSVRGRIRTDMRKRNGLAALAVSVLLAGLAASPAQAGPRTGPGSWQSYLEQPATSNVAAVSATVLSGDVTNARALTSDGHGDATLTVTSASGPATVLPLATVQARGLHLAA